MQEYSSEKESEKRMWAAMTRSIEILVAFIEYYAASAANTVEETARYLVYK